MRMYVETGDPQRPAQALQVWDGRVLYAFRMAHAAEEQPQELCFRRRSPHEHTHDVYHVVLYTSGRNQFALNGVRHTARRGVLALAAPGDSHDFGAMHQGRTAYSEVTFALIAADQPLRCSFATLLGLYCGADLLPEPMPLLLPTHQTEELERLFTSLLDWLETPGPLSALFAQQACAQVLTFLAHTCFRIETRPGERNQAPLDKARRFIERHYQRPLTLDEIARQASLSPSYFVRAFKRACGHTPLAYLQQIRVEAASTLLRTTTLRCREIADRVGYADPYHFSRTFKKVTRLSPTHFRQNDSTVAKINR